MIALSEDKSLCRSGLLELLERFVIPENRPFVQKVLLGMWAQWEGRGLRGVVENLLSPIAAEQSRLSGLAELNGSQRSYLEDLKEWSKGLTILLTAIAAFEEPSVESGANEFSKFVEGTHPLSRHGFTSNSLYAAMWTQYENTDNLPQACADYKKLRWWWIRVQSMILSSHSNGWEKFLSSLVAGKSNAELRETLRKQASSVDDEANALSESETEPKGTVVTPDVIREITGISFEALGRTLRRLSESVHAEFLTAAAKCCSDDLYVGLEQFRHLENKVALWKSPDAGLKKDQVRFAEAFRLVAEKLVRPGKKKEPSTRSGGDGRSPGTSKNGGYTGGPQYITHESPPENLSELGDWTPSTEIVSVGEEDDVPGDDGVEAPRHTGLKLVKPEDIRRHAAKAKAQSHHLAMVRQSFAWDANTLSPSERQILLALVVAVNLELVNPIPDGWWPKALVAVAWVCGRSLEEAAKMIYLDGNDWDLDQSNALAVGELDGQFCWRWPLRLPNAVKSESYTGGVPRVDRLVVPDCTGLAAALVRAHRLRKVSRQSNVFGWRKNPEKRLEEAEAVMADLHGDVVDRSVTKTLMSRDLRITLLNLVPDKTIAWMLAGTLADAKEPRMYYAAHEPEELVAWAIKAHQRMGLHVADTLPSTSMAEWPKSFAGAKFLPKVEQLRALAYNARDQARQFPRQDALAKPKVQVVQQQQANSHSNGSRGPESAGQTINASHDQWGDPARWRQWNDDVVFWVWVVQAMQTSQRATCYPGLIYQQWLDIQSRKCSQDRYLKKRQVNDLKKRKGKGRTWISLEDKRTADRDESRSGVLSLMLSNAFDFLTQVQTLFRVRWCKSPPKKSKTPSKPTRLKPGSPPCPCGFVVFDGGEKPKDLSPTWIKEQIKKRMGEHWPVNFNRAVLRRALALQGFDGDGLDAFLGHGSLADRVHDRHSLFNMGRHHRQLSSALDQCAEAFGLKRLDMPLAIRPGESELAKQRRQAAQEFRQKTQPSVSKLSADSTQTTEKAGSDRTPFEGWKVWVSRLLKRADTKGGLDHLKPWHAMLSTLDLPFARYVLGQNGPLSIFVGLLKPKELEALKEEHRKHAQVLEDQVVEWVAKGDMKRSVAAHGLNLSYLLCVAQDTRMPTMRVAMTTHARVSPFTRERVAQAELARQWSEGCLDSLDQSAFVCALEEAQAPEEYASTRQVFDDDEAKVRLALCSILNMTANEARWSAWVHSLLAPSAGKAPVHVFDASYDYLIKGLQGRMRNVRGFADVLSTHATPLPLLPEDIPGRVPDLYLLLRPMSVKVASGLSKWVHGIQWFGHMHLPPVIAAHLEGSLDDQSVHGPLAREMGWRDDHTSVRTRTGQGFGLNDDAPVAGLVPFTTGAHEPPFGWLPGVDPGGSEATAWLSGFLWDTVGAPGGASTLEDLSDALMEAWDEVPSKLRRAVSSLIAKIRRHHKLVLDDAINSSVDGVDRQVIDFETYNRVLQTLAESSLTSRMGPRQTRIRLLIVLAFRLGMRRREILCLRRGDIDLAGEGRIHIRPYEDMRPYADPSSQTAPDRVIRHNLKTGFSRRSLPISQLLNEQERQWLAQACEQSVDARHPSDPMRARLFPSSEHDTLAENAITLLRKVAGDDRLKLHHLRHSFASWMALKVVFARQAGWAEVFAGHPSICKEMLTSPELVGSILKPQLSAGDLLVIPRMLGHSSYQVSLTNYVHTLDLAAVLFLNHDFSEEILPVRERGRLIGQRLDAATALHKGAVSGYVRPHTNDAQGGVVVASVKPWSKSVADVLLDFAENGGFGSAVELPGAWSLPSAREVQNWHEPRHALGLRAELMAGVDRLDRADADRLVELSGTYWEDNPPMFWFGPRQINKASTIDSQGMSVDLAFETPATVQQDLGALLQILRKMDLPRGCVSFWRYNAAPAHEHAQMWGSLIEAHGFEAKFRERSSGSAKGIDTLGVSLGMNKAKRSPLPGVLWRTLGLVLSRME